MKKHIIELEKIDKMLWANIYCKLNRWHWPEELNNIKPKWWQDSRNSDRMVDVISPIMEHIKSVLGERWVSREWNKDRMTEEEHNKWWIEEKHYITRGC